MNDETPRLNESITEAPQESQETSLENRGIAIHEMSSEQLLKEMDSLIPKQYKGMQPDALKVVLDPKDVPLGLDGKPDSLEVSRREKLLVIIDDFLPEARKQEAFIRKVRIDRHNKLRELKIDLKMSDSDENSENRTDSLISKNLPEGQTNRRELLSGAVVALHNNDAHGQDALAIKNDAISLSDGASSYGKSGIVSQGLSERFATQLDGGSGIGEVLTEANVTDILKQVAQSQEFKNADTSLNPHCKDENVGSGLATVLLTKINRENKTLDWGSVGDSPLIVLDKKPDGSWSFEFVNDDANGTVVTSENFTDPNVIADLKNPETHLVGIRSDGTIDTRSLSKIKKGSIEYKPGRVVVAASDFLTKMMLCSPQVVEAMAKNAQSEGRDKLSDALRNANQEILKYSNPLADTKFKPELLFDGALSPEVITKAMEDWKKIPGNNAGVDDMTAVCIKMDEVFKE